MRRLPRGKACIHGNFYRPIILPILPRRKLRSTIVRLNKKARRSIIELVIFDAGFCDKGCAMSSCCAFRVERVNCYPEDTLRILIDSKASTSETLIQMGDSRLPPNFPDFSSEICGGVQIMSITP